MELNVNKIVGVTRKFFDRINKDPKMKSGIHITDEEFIFTAFEKHEIGVARYCRSFKIKLHDIKLIAVSPRLVIDYECLFVLIVNMNGKIFPMPKYILKTEGLKNFENYYQLKPIRDEWEKFDYNHHFGKQDKVIYPPQHYWKNLFEHDWKLNLRQLYSWIYPKSFFGNIKAEYFHKDCE